MFSMETCRQRSCCVWGCWPLENEAKRCWTSAGPRDLSSSWIFCYSLAISSVAGKSSINEAFPATDDTRGGNHFRNISKTGDVFSWDPEQSTRTTLRTLMLDAFDELCGNWMMTIWPSQVYEGYEIRSSSTIIPQYPHLLMVEATMNDGYPLVFLTWLGPWP